MLRFDRILLVLALLAATAALLRPLAGDGSTALAGLDDPKQLGPADELVLSGEEPLTIRNDDGRIAWGERPTARAWSIGAVHIDRIIKATLQSSEYSAEREEIDSELREQDGVFGARAETITKEYGEIDNTDPNFPEAARRMEAIRQEYNQFMQMAQARTGALQAEQLERAYRELTEAVAVVADNQDIDLVYRFIPTDESFGAQQAEQAMLQIQMRSLLHYPDSIDITEEVLDELGLE